MKFVEQTFHLPHKMKFDRSVAGIGNMLNLSQKPLSRTLLRTRSCPSAAKKARETMLPGH